MRFRRVLTVVLLLSLGLCGCVTQPALPSISEGEISGVLEQCDVSAKETFMVDAFNWGRGTALLDMSGELRISCDRVHLSLLSWRADHGDDWRFLDNFALGGPLPSLEGFQAFDFWMGYLDDSMQRTFAVNVASGQVGYVPATDGQNWLHIDWIAHSTFVNLDANQLGAVESLILGGVSGPEWVPVPGWSDSFPGPTAPGWVSIDGLRWGVVVCTKDYQLYRFSGSDAAPSNFLSFADALWEFTT